MIRFYRPENSIQFVLQWRDQFLELTTPSFLLYLSCIVFNCPGIIVYLYSLHLVLFNNFSFLIVILWRDIIIIPSLISLIIVSFNFLNMFIRATLISLLSLTFDCSQFLLPAYFSWCVDNIYLFLCMFCSFLLELDILDNTVDPWANIGLNCMHPHIHGFFSIRILEKLLEIFNNWKKYFLFSSFS